LEESGQRKEELLQVRMVYVLPAVYVKQRRIEQLVGNAQHIV
jgi:hypothetical protein